MPSAYIFMSTSLEKYNGTLPVEKRNDGDYDLEFRDVSFRYPNQEQWSLRHVTCTHRSRTCGCRCR